MSSSKESAGESWTGITYLVLTLLIFSSSSSAYSYLNRMDPEVFDQCTVLCSSNMVGILFILCFYRQWLTLETFNSLKKKDWLWLLLGSLFYSVLAPYLFMSGLDSVTVADAAILSRMESINILILAFVFLGHTVSAWAAFNSSLTVLGIVLTLISPLLFFQQSADFSTGNVYILASGWCYSISLLISMKTLTTLPVAVIAIFRVAVGTVMYHFLVLFMGDDVMELYSLKLWTYMLPYGIVYVFGGQVFWLLALSNVSSLTLSVGTTCLFLLTIMWSVFLLKQVPTSSQWVGVGVISLSIASSVAEKLYVAKYGAAAAALAKANGGGGGESGVPPALSPLHSLLQADAAGDPRELYERLVTHDEDAEAEAEGERLGDEDDGAAAAGAAARGARLSSASSSDGSSESRDGASGLGGGRGQSRRSRSSAWSDAFRAISSDRHVSYDRFDSASFDNAAVGFKGF